jgi:hypothetical protein
MNCPKCGRFCAAVRETPYYTGTWNDIIVSGICATHGPQKVSTV